MVWMGRTSYQKLLREKPSSKGNSTSQVTELNRDRIEIAENPELSLDVQSLKEKLDEHSKQLEQSAEKLSQLE
ncbi:LOW QUALITY PROTEIN: hypothetical protein HID58_067050 [Brassica napus]|uniref:Uncharacterized protein n=1 Tax=Brassica napus TaxID=3708 RepID=A0ABQ7ZHI1_BRANA|nr:LOW QUALITY PROTEIN: hypothetical protein HID58_067050 [Brassica napus]